MRSFRGASDIASTASAFRLGLYDWDHASYVSLRASSIVIFSGL